jgi:hypothetical protein
MLVSKTFIILLQVASYLGANTQIIFVKEEQLSKET